MESDHQGLSEGDRCSVRPRRRCARALSRPSVADLGVRLPASAIVRGLTSLLEAGSERPVAESALELADV